MEGWIKLHRKILDSPLWKDCNNTQRTIMIYLLLKANHRPDRWIFKGEKIEVDAGEFITSANTIMNDLGCSRQEVRTALAKFERYGFCNQVSTTKPTKLSTKLKIAKWKQYQDVDPCGKLEPNQVTNQVLTKFQPSPNQVTTTNKNVRIKELNNINNKECVSNINNNINARTRYYSNNLDENEVIHSDKSEIINDKKTYPQVQNGVKKEDFYKKVNARLLGKENLPTQAQMNLINELMEELRDIKAFIKIVDYVTLAFKYPSYKNLKTIASEVEREFSLTVEGVDEFLEARNNRRKNQMQNKQIPKARSRPNNQNFKQDTYRKMTQKEAEQIMRKNNPALKKKKEK